MGVVKKKSIIAVALLVCLNNAFALTEGEQEQPSQSIVFNDIAKECSNDVHPYTLQALVRVESGFNPYAIGVVGGAVKQPTTFEEAVATAKALDAQGKNFSMGLGQINKYNLYSYGLDYSSVFDVCKNLNTAGLILKECFNRASGNDQEALQRALSCYYSGNFKTGFTQDFKGQLPYVEKVKQASLKNTDTEVIKQIPAIDANVVVQSTESPKKAKISSKPKAKQELSPATSEKPRYAWDAFGDF